MKRVTFFLLFACNILFIYASNDSIRNHRPLTITLSGDVGGFMRGTVVDKEFGSRPILGGEISAEWQIRPISSLGVAVGVHDLTNNQSLGQAISAYAFMHIPFVRRAHFEIGIRPGVGLCTVTRWYGNTVSEEKRHQPGAIKEDGVNGAIGSCLNAYLSAMIYMTFPIRDGWAITLNGGWHHISNASIIQPNTGYNMIMGQIGAQYTLFGEKEPTHRPERWPEGEKKKWDVEITATGGVRQAYFADDKFYGIASVGVAAHWRACEVFKLGGGLDMFYDGYYTETTVGSDKTSRFSKTYLSESEVKNCFRLGISLQPEFIIGKLSAGVHIGIYLYDPVKNLEPYSTVEKEGVQHRGLFYKYDILEGGRIEDGWLYTRFLLKYSVTRQLFIQLGVKTHGPKAEFADLGLGVRI